VHAGRWGGRSASRAARAEQHHRARPARARPARGTPCGRRRRIPKAGSN
jgi:hypothetical protein